VSSCVLLVYQVVSYWCVKLCFVAVSSYVLLLCSIGDKKNTDLRQYCEAKKIKKETSSMHHFFLASPSDASSISSSPLM